MVELLARCCHICSIALCRSWTEFKSRGPLVQRRKEAPDHMFDMRLGKHADTGLHDQIFVKNKDLGADAGLVGRRIVGPSQFSHGIRGGTFETGAQNPASLTSEVEIFHWQ